jgi:hypothetical protein
MLEQRPATRKKMPAGEARAILESRPRLDSEDWLALGKDIGQGLFTGKQGTVLQVESYDGRNGVAVNNKGNIYKLVW